MSVKTDDVDPTIKYLIISWLDSYFGPLYYMTLRVKLSRFQGSPPEKLLLHNPSALYRAISQTFESEIIAESFLCTLIAYARKLGMREPPACEDLMRWFKNNDANMIRSFISSLAELYRTSKPS